MPKKILSIQQIREADAYTILHEPVSSLLLMERAAHACFQWLRHHYDPAFNVKIFCGTGNNGGDGLVIADFFLAQQRKVSVYIVRYSDKSSPDFIINEKRLLKNYRQDIFNIHTEKDFPEIDRNDVVIDALFGTGFNKPLQSLMAQVIKSLNNSGADIIAIDVPSGLTADATSESETLHSPVINAKHTLTFQLKKLAFYFAENLRFFGNVHVMDIKLNKRFIDSCESDFYEIEKEDIKLIIKPRNEFAHKGTYGHALLMCGSFGKMGAAVLSAKACLRSGAGLLTVNIPSCGYQVVQTSVPEAMVICSDEKIISTGIHIDFNKFNAIGIGPGIGTEPGTEQLLIELMDQYHKPLVLDADALNILSRHKDWLNRIPAESILTPHQKEFERLTEKTTDDFHRNQLQRNFSRDYNCYVVLKGHNTCISAPGGKCYFNPTGNPGMATGGSGDVLTGILTGLLAQGYSSLQACLAGVFLHGMAGDIAASKLSQYAMLASDIIENTGEAYKEIVDNRP